MKIYFLLGRVSVKAHSKFKKKEMDKKARREQVRMFDYICQKLYINGALDVLVLRLPSCDETKRTSFCQNDVLRVDHPELRCLFRLFLSAPTSTAILSCINWPHATWKWRHNRATFKSPTSGRNLLLYVVPLFLHFLQESCSILQFWSLQTAIRLHHARHLQPSRCSRLRQMCWRHPLRSRLRTRMWRRRWHAADVFVCSGSTHIVCGHSSSLWSSHETLF